MFLLLLPLCPSHTFISTVAAKPRVMLSGRLTEVLKMAAQSVKKEHTLPAVALDLLKLSLREGSFQLFWNNIIINGMLKEQAGPTQ